LQGADGLATKRIYLVLHHVLKELSSKRLVADQKNFAEVGFGLVQGLPNPKATVIFQYFRHSPQSRPPRFHRPLHRGPTVYTTADNILQPQEIQLSSSRTPLGAKKTPPPVKHLHLLIVPQSMLIVPQSVLIVPQSMLIVP
jgi:hypothetical protein